MTGRSSPQNYAPPSTCLNKTYVPRTSPTCRAEFCGRGCGLSVAHFTSRQRLAAIDLDRNRVPPLTVCHRKAFSMEVCGF